MAGLLRVLICDDHVRVRDGLRKLLEREPDLVVIGEAANAAEAIEKSRSEQPDVLVLDVAMPGRSGIDSLPDLIAAAPAAKILMLSMQDGPAYVGQALVAGASGYLLKQAADTHLVPAIRAVARGQRFVHPLADAGAGGGETAAGTQTGAALSERERAVLRRLAQGHTNREIARQLLISVRTAETARAALAQKLGLRTRAEIVRYALATGALDSR